MPVGYRFKGKEQNGWAYKGKADSLLATLKNDMDFNQLGQNSRIVDLPGGVQIKVKSMFGLDVIDIATPEQHEEGQEILVELQPERWVIPLVYITAHADDIQYGDPLYLVKASNGMKHEEIKLSEKDLNLWPDMSDPDWEKKQKVVKAKYAWPNSFYGLAQEGSAFNVYGNPIVTSVNETLPSHTVFYPYYQIFTGTASMNWVTYEQPGGMGTPIYTIHWIRNDLISVYAAQVVETRQRKTTFTIKYYAYENGSYVLKTLVEKVYTSTEVLTLEYIQYSYDYKTYAEGVLVGEDSRDADLSSPPPPDSNLTSYPGIRRLVGVNLDYWMPHEDLEAIKTKDEYIYTYTLDHCHYQRTAYLASEFSRSLTGYNDLELSILDEGGYMYWPAEPEYLTSGIGLEWNPICVSTLGGQNGYRTFHPKWEQNDISTKKIICVNAPSEIEVSNMTYSGTRTWAKHTAMADPEDYDLGDRIARRMFEDDGCRNWNYKHRTSATEIFTGRFAMYTLFTHFYYWMTQHVYIKTFILTPWPSDSSGYFTTEPSGYNDTYNLFSSLRLIGDMSKADDVKYMVFVAKGDELSNIIKGEREFTDSVVYNSGSFSVTHNLFAKDEHKNVLIGNGDMKVNIFKYTTPTYVQSPIMANIPE